MLITVLFFAKARDVTQTPQASIELPEGSTAQGLVRLLVQRYPGLDSVMKSCVLAVNQEYVKLSEEAPLREGDEVAVIPPLSGG